MLSKEIIQKSMPVFRVFRILISIMVLSLLFCENVAAGKGKSKDYYFEFNKEEIEWLVVSCLSRYAKHDNEACSCEMSWRGYEGASFRRRPPYYVQSWKQEKIDKNIGAIQVKVKDFGSVYQTEIIIDVAVFFKKYKKKRGRRSGVERAKVTKVYPAGWGFNSDFVHTVALVSGATVSLAQKAGEYNAASKNDGCGYEILEKNQKRLNTNAQGSGLNPAVG